MKNLYEVISYAKELAARAAKSLAELGIDVEERHNVLVPGTPTTAERSKDLLKKALNESGNKASIYMGLDVCPYICKFCRYSNRTAKKEKLPEMIEESLRNLVKEMDIAVERLSPDEKIKASSIYIGGGTPSSMSQEQMAWLFDSLKKNFSINSGTEITMECAPDAIDGDKLLAMEKLGVNRISMGVQRLDDGWLLKMGRCHSSKDVLEALRLFQNNGMRFNVDLMYGFSGQNIELFAADLLKILEYEPTEITLYRLEDQKRTDDKKIEVEKADRKSTYAMQETGRVILTNSGYTEGPAGWFTKKGFSKAEVYEDRWNKQIPLLGFGPGAYSFSKYQQHTNKPFMEWQEAIKRGQEILDVERVYEYSNNQIGIRRMIFDLKSNFETNFDAGQRSFFSSLVKAGLGELMGGNGFRLNKCGIIAVEEIIRVLIGMAN